MAKRPFTDKFEPLEQLQNKEKQLKLQIKSLEEELSETARKIEIAEAEQRLHYDWVWKNGKTEICKRYDDEEVLYYSLSRDFEVEFKCSAGPIGRLDEFEGEIEFEVHNYNDRLPESAFIDLFTDEHFDIRDVDDIDHKTRYGSWDAIHSVYVYAKTMFIPDRYLTDQDWMQKRGPEILYTYGNLVNALQPPDIYSKVDEKSVAFHIKDARVQLSQEYFKDDDKLIEAIISNYHICNEMKDGNFDGVISKYQKFPSVVLVQPKNTDN